MSRYDLPRNVYFVVAMARQLVHQYDKLDFVYSHGLLLCIRDVAFNPGDLADLPDQN